MPSKSFGVEQNAEGEILLSGDFDFYNVVQATSDVKDLINQVNDIRLNLKNVQHTDSSGLAMLLEFIRLARVQNKTITINFMPKFMLNLGRVYGLDTVLPINKSLNFENLQREEKSSC